MKISKAICFLLIAAFMVPSGFAFETDQFRLPSEPLADIGDEISDYTFENIKNAVAKLNNKIEKCIADENCEHSKLVYLQSEDAIALEVFRSLGSGFIPFTKAGTFVEKHKFVHQPSRFKSDYGDSIYQLVPTNYFTMSPTIKMYGSEFGTDKIAHFFQQGYDYYKIYRKALSEKNSEKEAEKKAIKWGKRTESTYFGKLVSGVYSNADLYSNFAGLRFYQGLTRPIAVGDKLRPAILYLTEGRWGFDMNVDLYAMLLRPLISDHLNEAWNSSLYIPGLRSSVRKTVRTKDCAAWLKEFPLMAKGDFERRTSEMRLWHGEDYGFKTSKKFVTIGNTCFE
jgi:hypothetical protein